MNLSRLSHSFGFWWHYRVLVIILMYWLKHAVFYFLEAIGFCGEFEWDLLEDWLSFLFQEVSKDALSNCCSFFSLLSILFMNFFYVFEKCTSNAFVRLQLNKIKQIFKKLQVDETLPRNSVVNCNFLKAADFKVWGI